MRVRPIEDRIIVKVEPHETVTKSGIIIGDPKRWEHPDRVGVVLATGPGLKNKKGSRDPMHVSVGDKIQFNGTAGMNVPWDDDDDVMIITQPDVQFIF
jgi:chaperonin GroES